MCYCNITETHICMSAIYLIINQFDTKILYSEIKI